MYCNSHKGKCLGAVVHMLVAEKSIIRLQVTLEGNSALKADSRNHLLMVEIFIFCMVHIQIFTTIMHLTAIMC